MLIQAMKYYFIERMVVGGGGGGGDVTSTTKGVERQKSLSRFHAANGMKIAIQKSHFLWNISSQSNQTALVC